MERGMGPMSMKAAAVLLALLVASVTHAQENPYSPLIAVPINTKDTFQRGMLEGMRLTVLMDNILEDQHMVFIDGEHCRSGQQEFCVYYSNWLLRLASDEFDAFEPYNPRTAMIEEKPEWPTGDDDPRPILKVRIASKHDTYVCPFDSRLICMH